MVTTSLNVLRRRSLTRILLAAFVLGSGTSAFAQGKTAPDIDRYQVVPVERTQVALIDTTTGECWVEERGKWLDLKFPVKATKGTQGTAGRFRLEATRDKDGQALTLVVWDTADGRCWLSPYRPVAMDWLAIASPRSK